MSRPLLLAALASTALACGGGGGNPDAGPTGPNPELFGLANDRCYVMTGGSNEYSILVQEDVDTFAPDLAWKLTHYYSGFRVRIEHFQVTADNLLQLRRVQKWNPGDGQNDTLWRFRTPADFTDAYPATNKVFETEMEADVSGFGQQNRTVPLTFKTEILEQGSVDWPGGPTDAFKFVTTTISENKILVDELWFAKNAGFLKFDPDGSLGGTNIGPMTLKSVRTLDRANGDTACVDR